MHVCTVLVRESSESDYCCSVAFGEGYKNPVRSGPFSNWLHTGYWFWLQGVEIDPIYARRSNQSVLKEINPEYSLEGLMLKLKLPYYGHLMWRANSLEKTLMLGKMEGRRKRGRHRMSWLNGITDWMDMSWRNSGREWRTGKPGMLQSMGSQRVRDDWATEQQLGIYRLCVINIFL